MAVNPNQTLQHYGILGMKWGVRRGRESDGRITNKKESSTDSKKASELRKKSASELTNVELRQLNERMNLEQQYKNLNIQQTNAGLKFVGNILKEVGKEVAKEFIKAQIKKSIDK
jgi:hypothetical protein